MSTRLDRLFLLLENGTTPVIRKSAAEQLGQVQKLHPHELYNLLDKVHTYLCSSNWDTRIAAAQAVEAIAKHVPKWDPKPIKLEGDAEAKEDHSASSAHLLSFQNFQISTVLAKATSLLASEGNEYDVHEDAIGGTPEERVALQKQHLNKRLGLDIAAQVGAIQVDQLFKEEDLVIKHEPTASTAQHHQQAPVSELVKQHLHMLQSQQRVGTGRSSPQGGAAMSTAACADPTLSARERNRAKRKAKLLSRQVSQDVSTAGDGSDGSESPVIKHRRISADTPHIADASAAVSVWDGNELTGWPFATFCGQLTSDLFNSSWEHRHGAATGLREILRLHGAGAGRLRCYDKQQILDSNQRWLEDTAIRLICVLALDRFGDFVADEVVAPVRETCAQTLGTVAHHMSAERTTACLRVILQLTEQKQWEVRHGGLLALKYVLAVKTDLTRELLPLVLPSLFVGLQDLDDDVRSVAAAALIPVTNALTQHYTDKVPEILQCLWLTLGDLDDLTSSTASILTLLADFLSKPHVLHQRLLGNLSLTNLVPLLFPFFRHANTSVRKSSMLTLKALTSQQHNAQSDGSSSTATWILPILLDTVRHVYQRVLMESKPELIPVIEETWTSVISCVPVEELASTVIPWLGVCLCLIMQAPHLPYDPQMIITAKHQPKELTPSRIRYAQHTSEQQLANNNIQVSSSNMNRKEYLGGHDTVSEPPHVRDRLVNRACLMGCRLAGLLYHQLTVSSQHSSTVESSIGAIVHTLSFYLASKSANQRIHVANSVAEWALVAQPKDCGCPDTMKEALVRALEENIYYEEITSIFGRMQTECRDFVAGLKLINADVDPSLVNIVYNIDQAQHLCTDAYNKIRANLKNKQLQLYDERRKALQDTVTSAANMQHTHTIRVQSSLAGALINLHHLPPKLNPVIRPLMESLKTEDNPQLQNRSALSLARLLLLIQHREPCPNPKVIRNITTMLCCDTSMTPSIADTPVVGSTGQEDDDDSNSSTHAPLSDQLPKCDRHTGIVSLAKVTKVAPIRPGRRVVNKKPSQYIDDSDVISSADGDRVKDKHQHSLQRRGAAYALTNMVRLCGDGLRTKLPALWDMLTASMCKYRDVATAGDTHEADSISAAQDLVNVLQVLEVVAPVLTSECRNQLSGHISLLCGYVQSWFSAVRHLSARCIAALVAYDVGRGMGVVFDTVLPLIHPAKPTQTRQGAMETLYLLIVELGVCIVPYIVLLLVPVLGLLSDRDASVRLLANQCFASLVKLAPLDSELDSDDLKDMSAELISRRVAERQFLDQLMDVSKLQNYHIPVTINATLRSYQQSGVDWLHFLCRYKLHGILCDDMGLGKTLQSLCVVAGIHHDIINSGDPCTTEPPRSLVVCPPTLTGHWVAEVEQFLPPDQLTPLHYAGNPQDRQRLQRHVAKHDVVIASYDSVRADIAFFSKLQWTYCILDEGHIIKNSKTKLSQAVKQLSCTHRLILSGTPIQNNVLELWSLFDFLMPGYLGTEKQFQARYGRPILQSRDAKSSSKEQEAGALAMESLHRQVLPFLLRRKKEDVLKDLPPKIIQDYYCDLSPIQVELYEDFARSRAKQEAEECISGEKVKKPVHHVFQALQYLRKVCNHPALVLNPQHPQYTAVQQRLRAENTTINHLQHAAKLTALRQLLLDCGIGGDSSEDNVVNQHRVLLFCQLKSMLDIIEKDLLKTHLPNVTYLRLDGSVPPIDRHGLVTRFNSDPSIDLLLLTTHVGGLGLNLTGADTVIFYDHDWNPMKDLQAMDRAHRIGQKRVVTVYRLVTRGTLEEKIMGLQRFKLHLANTVISDDNSSLAQMGTNQLLDLFTISASDRQHQTYSEKETGIGAGGSVDMSVGGVGSSLGGVGGKGEAKEVLSALGELWDEKQYENEYDLTEFIKHLHA